MKKSVLFLCTHNSARSQMAEGLLRETYGSRYVVESAGVEPTAVNPLTIVVMREIGIDLSGNRSKSIHEFEGRKFDIVVTVCDLARESCPFYPGVFIMHKSFPDPGVQPEGERDSLERFRHVRDEIKTWIDKAFSNKIEILTKDK